MEDDILRFSDFEASGKFQNINEKEFMENAFLGVLEYAKEQHINLERFVWLMETMAVQIRNNYQKIQGGQNET